MVLAGDEKGDLVNSSNRKIDAIYDLRRAAEEKALAEKTVADDPSPENRDRLLDTRLTLEAKTMTAIEACHECGHDHDPRTPHFS